MKSRLLVLAAAVLAVLTPRPLPAVCAAPTGATNPVTFISPANGSMEVARFPVMTVGFQNAISADTGTLAAGIRLLDRVGKAVTLTVRRDTYDDHLAIAHPAAAADRLDPTADYFLEVTLGTSSPSQAVRIHFMTGSAKSVFCMERVNEDWSDDTCLQLPAVRTSWRTTCDENYYMKAPPQGDEFILAGLCQSVQPPSDCACQVDHTTTGLNGWVPKCECAGETSLFSQSNPEQRVFIKSVTPAAGSSVDWGGQHAPIKVTLDRDLGSSSTSYEMMLEDITSGNVEPAIVSGTSLTYDGPMRQFRLSASGGALSPNTRYRATLRLKSSASVPTPWIVTTQPHAFQWTFNTWTGPAGHVTATLPKPRLTEVSFPTHLPLQPHLRVETDGPIRCGLGDLDAAPFEVRDPEGTLVTGVAAYVDQDMTRLHVMVYEKLFQGERYEVRCSSAFANASPQACTVDPVMRFLTQVDTPPDGATDIREGPIAQNPANGKLLLPVRPTVLNHPYGFKEEYLVDANGPVLFNQHVMIVPPAKGPTIGTIAIAPQSPPTACTSLPFQPIDGSVDEAPYLLGNDCSLCSGGTQTPGYSCQACPNEGNPDCPNGQSRCRYDFAKYQRALTDFCNAVIAPTGGSASYACDIQDAYRCLAGGNWGSAASERNRMRANDPLDPIVCPATHYYDDVNSCVPLGRIAIVVGAGEHYANLSVSANGGVSYAPSGNPEEPPTQESHPAPVEFRPAATATGLAKVTLKGTQVLAFAGLGNGLTIPVETCKTSGHGTTVTSGCIPGNPTSSPPGNCEWPHVCANDQCVDYSERFLCPETGGICDAPSRKCLLVPQGRVVQTAAGYCDASHACVSGYECNYVVGETAPGGRCKKTCSATIQCDSGFTCRDGFCSRPLPGDDSSCVADWGFMSIADPSGMHGGTVCVANPASSAFTCDANNCVARWVLVDAPHNIYRIWWPGHHGGSGGRQFLFAARAGQTDLAPLPLLAGMNLDPCNTQPDVEGCAKDVCDTWNQMTYRVQVETQMERLAGDQYPAPYGFWAHGYHALRGWAQNTQVECLADRSGISAASWLDLDGPEGLFVKLPSGTTINDWKVEGSPETAFGFAVDPYDLEMRGLTFTGMSSSLWVSDAESVTLQGNQFFGTTLGTVGYAAFSPHEQTPGETEEFTFSHNYTHGISAIGEGTVTTRNIVVNNVTTEVNDKVYDNFQVFSGTTPTVCTTGATCVKPSCRPGRDADCRIPFWDSSQGVPASLTTDPTLVGTTPTCIGTGGIGVCSHGLLDQGLFTDNIIIDTPGPHGRWNRQRMQRNHLENIAGQEAFDADYATWTSILDNVIFNVMSAANVLNMGELGATDQARGLAIDGNFLIKNAPEARAMNAFKWWPGRGAGWHFTLHADHQSASGLRMARNTIVARPGAAEWGDIGMFAVSEWPQALIADNTYVADSVYGTNIDETAPVPPGGATGNPPDSSAGVRGNLLLTSTFHDNRDALCDPTRATDIWTGTSPITIGPNASLFSTMSPTFPSGYDCLRIEDRRRIFKEPVPLSARVDYENYLKHLKMTASERRQAFHDWPVFDAALLDGSYAVRPTHAACGQGAPQDGNPADDCNIPDTDGDLYADSVDNCPSVSNPGQEDCNNDGVGNACDGITDHDGDGSPDAVDCSDCDSTIKPGISELGASLARCSDGVDSNCNGIVDLDCQLNTDAQQVSIGNGMALTITGSAADLSYAPDGNAYEDITETGNPNNKKSMTKVWAFNNVPSATGATYKLRMEGFRPPTSDSEQVTFYVKTQTSSTCSASGPYAQFSPNLTITKTADDDAVQTGVIGTVIAGRTVCIMMKDQGQDNPVTQIKLDRVFIDPLP